jgi:hypothetical protein
VKESFTAAIVVRSLLAAERSSWLVGLLVGWVVVRLVACWPVVGSVVVAVDVERMGLRVDGLRDGAAGGNLLAAFQFPPASPWNAPMLNRSAVIVRPKEPFCDWLRAVDYDDAPEVTLDQMGPTLYLVPDYEDPADADKVLKKVCDEIFCRELEGWYTDVEVWPKDRSLKIFKQWFDVQHHEVVEDVGRGPIENDEGPDEKHRFSSPPPPRRPTPVKKPQR